MRFNATVEAMDQAGRPMLAKLFMMGFSDAVDGMASYFHWSYPEVGGDGKCWVRVHATDKERHPCSTSHIRKHPLLYRVLYPDLYPEGPPGPLSQRLQCDMSEFTHLDPDAVLKYTRYMGESTAMCFQLRIRLTPATVDRQSSVARAFLWHEGGARPMSGRVTTQLNAFFNYADIRDPTTPNYPVSRMLLRKLQYNITAVKSKAEQPVLRLGTFCSHALKELSESGKLEDSKPKGDAPSKARNVRPSDLESIPHPYPKMCFPDLSMQTIDSKGNAYRIALRYQAGVMGSSTIKIPDPFYKLGPLKGNRPLSYNYFNTYLSNDTSQFLTIAFQEPTAMFAEEGHTHLVGNARMERVGENGQYYVHTLPFTLVYLNGYMIRPIVAAYNDENFSIMIHARAEHAYRRTKCFCGMEAEAVPACFKDDCSEEWKNPVPIHLQKVAGLKPLLVCCRTVNCLNPKFNWNRCRL